MDDLPAMSELESVADRFANFNGVLKRETILFRGLQQLFDVAALQDFGDEVRRLVFLAEVEALDEASQLALLAGVRAERWRVIAGTAGLDPDRLREDLYALLEAGYVAVDRVGEVVASA